MQIQNELQFNSLVNRSNNSVEQVRLVNECLTQIDDILKRECMFCGPILIDMIDNDIEGDTKSSEFGANSLFNASKSSEWDII